MEDLKYEILKVLAFYDIFKFPLTPLEVHKNLSAAADFADIVAGLDELKKDNKIILQSGFFSLRAGLAEERKARFLSSFKKMERAKRIACLFAWFPFVKFAGVCNSLGFFNSADKSDIDFFIVAESGRLWTARFFTNLFLKIFNLRPTRESNKDKICLSFFIGDGDLDVSRVAISGGDPYFYHWMAWLLPLYDDRIYKKFIDANVWIKNHLPNFTAQDNYFSPRRRPLKRIMEKIIAGRLEQKLKDFQMKVMPKELKEAVSRGDQSVVMDEKMLKFHLLDRRAEYREKFYKNFSTMNIKQ